MEDRVLIEDLVHKFADEYTKCLVTPDKFDAYDGEVTDDLFEDLMYNPFPIRVVQVTKETHKMPKGLDVQQEIGLIGINGAGFRILRRYTMALKAGYLRHLQALPHTGIFNGTYTVLKPRDKSGEKPMYIFCAVPDVVRSIRAFKDLIVKFAERYGEKELVFSKKGSGPGAYGIVGIDVPFKEPAWVTEIKKGKALFNPAISSDGTYFFGEESLDIKRVYKAIRYLFKTSSGKIWKKLHTGVNRSRFVSGGGDYAVTVGAIGDHARVFMRVMDENRKPEIWIIDPWKRVADMVEDEAMVEFLKKAPKNMHFVLKELDVPDQGDEGSCVLAAFARALWIAKDGPEVAQRGPIPHEFAVLSLRLLRTKHSGTGKGKLPEDEYEEDKDEIKAPTQKIVRKTAGQRKEDEDYEEEEDPKKKKKAQKDKANDYEDDYAHNRHKEIHDMEPFKRHMIGKRKESPVAAHHQRVGTHNCMKYDSTKLLPHQKRVIKFMMDSKQRSILLNHSLGSGKTITSIAIARCLLTKNVKIAFVTPSSVVKQFDKEVQKLGKLAGTYQVYSHAKFAKDAHDIIDDKTILVIDEVHNFRSKDSIRTKAVINAARNAYKVVVLSATPIVNSSDDLVPLMLLLNGYSMEKWAAMEKIVGKGAEGRELRDLLRCKISYYSVPMDLKNFPRVSEHYKTFRMNPEHYQEYVKVQNQDIRNLEVEIVGEGENAKKVKKEKNLTVFFNGVRRLSNRLLENPVASEKVVWAVKEASKLAQKGKKSVMFTAFKETGIELIGKMLEEEGVQYVVVDGSKTPAQRMSNIQKYNTGQVPVLIFTMAGAEGMDLKNTNTLFVIDPWWNANKMGQIAGRVARYQSHVSMPPKERHVNIYYLVLKKPRQLDKSDVVRLSIDEILYRVSEEKELENVPYYDMIRHNSSEQCRKAEMLKN